MSFKEEFHSLSKTKVYCQGNLEGEFIDKVKKCFDYKEWAKDREIELLKEVKGRKVFRINYFGDNFYVKKYSYRNFKKRFKNIFRPEEGVRSFNTSKRLKKFGIPVVEPVLALVYQHNLVTSDSLFVTKEFSGLDLYQALVKYGDDINLRSVIIRKMGQLWADFINNKFIHRDAALWNFLVSIDGQEVDLSLVDVDNIYWTPLSSKRLEVKTLANFNATLIRQFLKSGKDTLTYEERVSFLKEFLKYYKRELGFKPFVRLLNKETIKRTVGRREELVYEDDYLGEIYKEM